MPDTHRFVRCRGAQVAALGLVAGLLFAALGRPSRAEGDAHKVTAADAEQLLRTANDRFASGKAERPDLSAERRSALTADQSPYAVIVSCSDSRVPPEMVFNCGLGNLFVVRTAGEVVDDVALGSIEYAVEHLHTPLVVVMGHQSCGAVTSTIKALDSGGPLPEGGIGALVRHIKPAVDAARDKPGDRVANAVEAQVRAVRAQLAEGHNEVAALVGKGELKVKGAVYSLETGTVSWLD